MDILTLYSRFYVHNLSELVGTNIVSKITKFQLFELFYILKYTQRVANLLTFNVNYNQSESKYLKQKLISGYIPIALAF